MRVRSSSLRFLLLLLVVVAAVAFVVPADAWFIPRPIATRHNGCCSYSSPMSSSSRFVPMRQQRTSCLVAVYLHAGKVVSSKDGGIRTISGMSDSGWTAASRSLYHHQRDRHRARLTSCAAVRRKTDKMSSTKPPTGATKTTTSSFRRPKPSSPSPMPPPLVRERITDPWKLILLYMTPWKNPNSIFVYMFALLYLLGKISEQK